MIRLLGTLVCAILIFSVTPAIAADPSSSMTKTCIVIVGDAAVKTPDYLQYVNDTFNNEEKKIVSGTEIQSKYQTYWLDKGFLEEQKLTKQDLHDFVKYSGYNKVLFLIVNSPIMEKTKQGGGGWYGWSTTERTRASLNIKSFLATEDSVIKSVEVTKEDDSLTSELRAKRGAFQKCLIDIKNTIGNLI